MDYYTSTEFMYETDNVPHYAGSLLEVPYEKYSERMLILLDIHSMFEVCFADDLDSDNYCYGVYTFAEFGLNDNDALSYLITQDELTQFQEYFEEEEYNVETNIINVFSDLINTVKQLNGKIDNLENSNKDNFGITIN